MNDFSVLNRDDRDEPVIIEGTIRKNPSVYLILEDHDATVLRAVHNKCVAGVKLDRRNRSAPSFQSQYCLKSTGERRNIVKR
jgi:hypothetical protein